jgi:hypothetical protein
MAQAMCHTGEILHPPNNMFLGQLGNLSDKHYQKLDYQLHYLPNR